MERIPVEISVTGIQNKMLRDYLEGNPQLSDFYKWNPTMDSFADVIKEREKISINRPILHSELVKQHLEYYDQYPAVWENVDAILSDQTFTVTTGHQLCLATGPLYLIYKIISAINLAKELKERFADYNFVPVYWMATEDHDFEEINHIHLFGKQLKWHHDAKGATGRLSTATIDEFISQLKEVCGESENAAKLIALFEKAYKGKNNLADATRDFVLNFFGNAGLLVLDADRVELKKLFIPVVHKELEEQASFRLVTETNNRLGEYYPLQVNPRPLNLFYLDTDLRERIVKAPDEHFEIVNTDLIFSPKFMFDLLDHQPERFSPNVVLRPVYQEMILPNLAYIGGPGELTYWMQLKAVFDYYGVFYPMLVPRNHALVIGQKQLQKFKSLGFDVNDLFSNVDELTSRYVKSIDGVPAGFDAQKNDLKALYESLSVQLAKVDSTLQGSAQAEAQKALNGLENLEKKLQSSLKKKNETSVSQIKNTLDKVNPSQQPQERYLNFIQFYLKYGDSFISEIMKDLKPLDPSLNLFVESES